MASDLANLQGPWTLAALRIDGADLPAGGGIRIDGDRFTTVAMGAEYAGTVVVDEAATPKHFDLIFSDGPESGNRNFGIYELDGGTWRLCLNMTGQSRPSAFAAEPGSGNALEVFTRGAAAVMEPEPAAAAAATGEGELVGEWAMQAAYQGGQALDASMVKTGRRITSATETTTYFGKQVFLQATYTTDASLTPKTIDLLLKNGKTQLGIYEVDGDTMRICFTTPGKPRPADFESRPADGRTSAVWKRVGSAAAKA
jgi:uncharacterized protein (TIGR03067 family)